MAPRRSAWDFFVFVAFLLYSLLVYFHLSPFSCLVFRWLAPLGRASIVLLGLYLLLALLRLFVFFSHSTLQPLHLTVGRNNLSLMLRLITHSWCYGSERRTCEIFCLVFSILFPRLITTSDVHRLIPILGLSHGQILSG